jgi:glycosyltransferase involved in cell wall biosynthesis
MKLLLISTRFPPLVGGVEVVVKNIADNISKDNEVQVITSLDTNTLADTVNTPKGLLRFLNKLRLGFKVEDKNIIKDDYMVKKIWINMPSSRIGRISFPYRFLAGLISLIIFTKKYNPDIINYHFPDDSSAYIYFLIRAVKKPFVLNIHGNDLHVFSYKTYHKFFINRLVEMAEKIVVNGNYMKEEFNKRFEGYNSKIDVIPNGVDVEDIIKVKGEQIISEKYAFFIGRLVYKKGVDILLKGFAKADVPALKLIIEGRGEESDLMKALSLDLDIANSVVFTDGKLSSEDKFRYMKGAMMGIVPSRVEPFGIVALEMMASGIPIIASKTGGLINILKDGETCLFFENEDVADLSEKIIELTVNTNLRERLVKNALVEVKKFDLKIIAGEYDRLYRQCIKK